MVRYAVLLAVHVIVAVLLAVPASAHGGQFRTPGDAVPPGLRDPSDPTPPPPPPPTKGPSTPTPGTPTPATPTPGTPTTPTQGAPTTGLPSSAGRTRPRSKGPSYEDWPFWYAYNNADLENLKRHIYELGPTTSSIFQSGDGDAVSRTAATRLTQREVETVVIPALLWAMDPKNSGYTDTESAAYLALAKVARSPDHIRTLMKGLDKRAKHDLVVQESAALALGLLRRADPADQFTVRDLDEVRTFLFDVFQDDEYQARTRGFAAVALGLLGDQPTGSGEYAGDAQAAASRTTQRLFELLRDEYKNPDLEVALLMAIGLQPTHSLTTEDREVLADAAFKGRLFRKKISDVTRAHAAHALGRVGVTANDRNSLANILTARRNMPAVVQQSAAIGLGLLGRQVSGADRVEVARVLLEGIDRTKDNSTRNFAIISLAYLLIEDIHNQTTDVMGNSRADETLLEVAADGRALVRPFAAIALGLVARAITDDLLMEDHQRFKQRALETLREGLADSADKKVTAGFCVAAGIARDSGSRSTLLDFVRDRKGDKLLRGYAALSLGLVGEPNTEVLRAIADALRERSTRELRRQSAVALGLLGDHVLPGTGKTAVQVLLEELKQARSQSHKGQIVLALASIGNHEAVSDLVRILKDEREQDLTRALACAGLGLIGDLEWIPSLARVSKHVNYRASNDLLNELLSIL